jgi:hypothetical protein
MPITHIDVADSTTEGSGDVSAQRRGARPSALDPAVVLAQLQQSLADLHDLVARQRGHRHEQRLRDLVQKPLRRQDVAQCIVPVQLPGLSRTRAHAGRRGDRLALVFLGERDGPGLGPGLE